MVKIARNPLFTAKTPLQTMIFHQKTSKTIDFSWFSLSELSYSKSQQPTCLPRGQVAPQVNISTATPPIEPRGEGGAAVAT